MGSRYAREDKKEGDIGVQKVLVPVNKNSFCSSFMSSSVPHETPPSTSLVCGDNSTRCLERGEATGSKTMFSLPSFILFNMLGVDSLRFFKLYDRS